MAPKLQMIAHPTANSFFDFSRIDSKSEKLQIIDLNTKQNLDRIWIVLEVNEYLTWYLLYKFT